MNEDDRNESPPLARHLWMAEMIVEKTLAQNDTAEEAERRLRSSIVCMGDDYNSKLLKRLTIELFPFYALNPYYLEQVSAFRLMAEELIERDFPEE